MCKADDIRRALALRGISIKEWSESRGFSSALVYQVLNGKAKAERGQCHRIAVALGLKNGVIADLSEPLPFEINNTNQNSEEMTPQLSLPGVKP